MKIRKQRETYQRIHKSMERSGNRAAGFIKRHMLIRNSMAAIVIIVTILSLAACGFSKEASSDSAASAAGGETQEIMSENVTESTGSIIPAQTQNRVDTGFVLTGPESYDSADTPVVVDKNKEDNTVTFLNLELGRRYTLSLDGTTKFYDKYGESISLDQIQKGDIVDVTFLKSKKHLTSMQLSAKAWNYDNVERYEINTVRGEVTIGEEVFKLTDNTQYLSEGRNIEQMDINAADILSFQGIDSQIVSISVEKGHGYLRLANDEYFVGGWIEIGQSLIQRITEDMLLTVPEGSYQVNISHNGSGGIKSIIINRNEETTLDIGDLEIAEPQTGMVLFSLSPSNAQLYIDGEKADASQPVTLEYGTHQLIVKADGYKSVTQYLRVGQESGGVDIVLDAVDTADDSSTSSTAGSESSESSTQVDTTTDYYKVYVDAPEGAEVYLDGNYVGISPCNFRKEAGSHVITLRKTGYETRSYTVQVDSEEKDTTYSFADLVVSGTGLSSVEDLVSEALKALGQ